MNSRISSNNLSFTSKIFSEWLRFCCIHIMATISNSPLPIENNCAPTLETIRLTLSIFVNLSEQFLVQSSWPSGHILCMVFDYFLFQLIVLELSVTKNSSSASLKYLCISFSTLRVEVTPDSETRFYYCCYSVGHGLWSGKRAECQCYMQIKLWKTERQANPTRTKKYLKKTIPISNLPALRHEKIVSVALYVYIMIGCELYK